MTKAQYARTPSKESRASQFNVVITKQHAARMAKGRTESRPSDYERVPTEAERMRIVRRRIEEMKDQKWIEKQDQGGYM